MFLKASGHQSSPQTPGKTSTQRMSDTLQATEFSASGSRVQAGPWVREVALHSHRISRHQDSAGGGRDLGQDQGAGPWFSRGQSRCGGCRDWTESAIVTRRTRRLTRWRCWLPPTSQCTQQSGNPGVRAEKAKRTGSRKSGFAEQPDSGPHSPSAPMDTSLTPLLAMKSRALLTLEILCTLILPLSGLAKRSPACRLRGRAGRVECCFLGAWLLS